MSAMDGMAVLHKENGMRHGRVVPLLAVPDLVHGGGRVGSRGRRIAGFPRRDWPAVALDAVDEDGHFLLRLVDIDQDLGASLEVCGGGLVFSPILRFERRRSLGFGLRGGSSFGLRLCGSIGLHLRAWCGLGRRILSISAVLSSCGKREREHQKWGGDEA